SRSRRPKRRASRSASSSRTAAAAHAPPHPSRARCSTLSSPKRTMSLASLEWSRSATGGRKRGFRGFVVDMPLLLILFSIVGLGMVVLYSAVSAESGLLIRQAMRFAVGLGAFFVMAQIPPHYLRLFTPWMYFLGIGLLLFVAVEGQIGKGAQRWLDLGVVTFQPSQLLKLAVPMMFPQLMVMALIVLTPALLIVEQPDLGTALLVIAGGGITILLAGISVRLMLVFGGLGLATLPVLWTFMHDYQKARVLTFLNPESDPLGTGYNIIQSKIAIGSGGLFGKGWLEGSQSHLEFLPERSTDFIFAVMAEEFGLLGL